MIYMSTVILMIGAMTVFAADEAKTGDEVPSTVQDSLMGLGFQVFTTPVVAPDFTLKVLDGEEVALSDFRGKTVLLNFWATWCPPCRAEMPSMERMYGEFDRDELEILAVDLQESEKAVRNFIEDKEYTFPILLDTNGRVGSLYGARSIPTTYLIDEDGFAVGFIVGSREWDNEEVYEVLRMTLPASD